MWLMKRAFADLISLKKNMDLTDKTGFRRFDFVKKEHGCG
jgi:hypothetical protein